jgi:hypothetical protein
MTPNERAQCAAALAAVESPQQLRDRAHRLYALAWEMHKSDWFVEERDCQTAAAALHALAVMWERQQRETHSVDQKFGAPRWRVATVGELQWAWAFPEGGTLPEALAAVVRDE